MNQISTGARLGNRFKAFREKKALGRLPEFQSNKELGGAELTRLTVNTNEMAGSEAPVEVSHQLTDYRNGNEVLATKRMNRSKAAGLNARLRDTGFAWAVKTGY